MPNYRLPIGTSDPISFTCTCGASSPLSQAESLSSSSISQPSAFGGLVLLFYRYFDCPPALPPTLQHLRDDHTNLSSFQTTLTQTLSLGGKIRVSHEGFNITVGGTSSSINAYISACLSHWSFSSLDLSTLQAQRDFFKPSPGCACVFGLEGVPASVRVTEEITPMGVTGYRPRDWAGVESLMPEVWHEMFWSQEREAEVGQRNGKMVLLDVRNHYESRIGYFINPQTGEPAMRPEIRRFAQWPLYVRRCLSGHDMISSEEGADEEKGGRHIMTYCTGGIRCEKGVRFLAENMKRRKGDRVCTLRGGIAAYLMWMADEVKAGRKRPEESLFRGKNYVFDARGSTGLMADDTAKPVSKCAGCGKVEDRLSKCVSRNCHLILVVCEACERIEQPRCCTDCRYLDEQIFDGSARRPICQCEREREKRLWGSEKPGNGKVFQGSKKAEKRNGKDVKSEKIKIQVKTFG